MLTSVDVITSYGTYGTVLHLARFFFGCGVEKDGGIEQITREDR